MARLPTLPSIVCLRPCLCIWAIAFAGLGCTGNIGAAGPAEGSGGAGAVSGGAGPGAGPPPPSNSAPGVAQLRRLTVLEYRNTVRDLLGTGDAQMPELEGDQQAETSGFTTGAAITTASDARNLLDGADRLALAALPNLTGQVPCLADAAAGEPCARQFITQFGRRAFRRPLVNDEVDRWLGLYRSLRDSGVGATFSEAIRGLTTAFLQSPNFLYRHELAPGAAIKEGKFVRFNSYEMASRLSYSFWATMPDERLFALAEANKLQTTQAIQEEARRLLVSPKAKDVYGDFATQWLNLAPVVSALKSDALKFTPEVGRAMLSETSAFLADLFVRPGATGRLDELFTSTRTFADSTLAAIYGVGGVSGNGLAPVTLDPKERAGLFTQLGFLTMHGDSEGSFPTRRGAEILRRVFCRDIDIPANIVVPDVKPPSPGITTRQRFEEHAQNACAAACHLQFDPIGFAFEHYDGIGRYRTTDNGQPVDASGTIPIGSKMVTFTSAVDLMPALAQSDDVRACVATQWMRYLLRREESAGDRPSLDAVQKTFRASSYDMRELLVAIVGSDAFTRRTPALGEVLP